VEAKRNPLKKRPVKKPVQAAFNRRAETFLDNSKKVFEMNPIPPPSPEAYPNHQIHRPKKEVELPKRKNFKSEG